jgi:hypothetical protein
MSRRWKSRIRHAALCFSRIAPWLAAAVSLLAVALLVYVQLRNQGGKADTTTLGLLLIGVVLMFVIAAPVQAARAAKRITRLKVGAVELGLEEIKLAERVRPVPSEEDEVEAIRPLGCDYARVVAKLEGRLRFVREVLELEKAVKDKHDYIGITMCLREDGLLDGEEKRFMIDLLDGPNVGFDAWDDAARNDFLDAAYAFAVRLGPKVWDRRVKQELTDCGWFIADFNQSKKHRADFLAFRGSRTALMTARVGGTGSGYVEKAAPRLMNFDRFEPIEARVIVIPDKRHGAAKKEYEWSPDQPTGVRVLRLGDLKENPELPFKGLPSPATPRDR